MVERQEAQDLRDASLRDAQHPGKLGSRTDLAGIQQLPVDERLLDGACQRDGKPVVERAGFSELDADASVGSEPSAADRE